MDRVECVVIGAGVVGLACARALAQVGRDVIVIEAASQIGTETSSRNSEVIHAGIYYPTGSLKARACVEGRRMLYDYCQERRISHRRCGKLIVATDEAQIPTMRELIERAARNGVEDVHWLTADAAMELEPALRCIGAVLSASTGIIDSHGFMLALQGDLEDAGGVIAFGSRVIGGEVHADRVVLEIQDAHDITALQASMVVNSAGLSAHSLMASLRGFPEEAIPKVAFAKGNYFSCAHRSPFSRLIYPAPVDGGLGVHVTFDLGGSMRLGPDVEWIDRIDYEVDPARSATFYDAVRLYWPDLPDNSIHPGYAGIRAKLSGPGQAAADFVIQDAQTHGIPGLVNLLGIESPGLTSSLSLAQRVREVAEATFGVGCRR